ncbi:hypothetical protein D3C71_1798750 [compost metagenome]
MGTSHRPMASSMKSGPASAFNQSAREAARIFSLWVQTAGIRISRASSPTPLVMMPSPAANQPSQYQRQPPPQSRKRTKP